jgi:hypothetical protein
MGYIEEIFERIEVTGLTTKSEIQDWLSGQGTKHQKKRSGYSNFAAQLQEPFAIREDLERTEDFDALRTLRNQARTVEVPSARVQLVKDIEAKMSVVSKELVRITEERVEKRLEEKRLERTKAKLEKQLNKIRSNIPSATLGEIIKIEDRLEDIEEVGIDTSVSRELINDRVMEIEEEKELRITQQIESRERKINLREQGIEPNF